MLPAAGMEFVDVHGQITAFIPPLHPCAVVEGKVQFGQAAGVGGADFGRESVGVSPHDHAAVGPVDAVFVELPLAQPGDKAAPHAGVGFLERDACAPAVKAAADLHSRGTGSPDREAPALFAVVKQSPLKKDLGMEGRFIRKTPFIAIFTGNVYDGICEMRNIQHFYHTFVGKCAILNRTQMYFCRKSALL